MPSEPCVSKQLEARYRRLFAAKEEALRTEVREFLGWIFDDPLLRPCTIELLRRDRVESERFVDHQCDLFIRLGTLFQGFLAVYPHGTKDDLFVCENGICQEHLRLLDQLLRHPRAVDGDWLAAGPTPEQTPLSLAMHHLCVFEQQHADFMGALATDQLKLQLNDLAVQHQVAFRHRADRLRSSSARALRELIRWTGMGERHVEDFGMSAENVWTHLRRVHLDLQAIRTAAADLDSVLAAFRHRSERADAVRLRQLAALRHAESRSDAKLATEVARFLQDHGVRAWTSDRSAQVSMLHDSSALLVDAFVYSHGTAEPSIRTALRRLHAIMEPLAHGGNSCEALFVLFRLEGPAYETPLRLDFNQFAIRLAHIDLVEGPNKPTGRPVTPLDMTPGDLVAELDPTLVSGTAARSKHSVLAPLLRARREMPVFRSADTMWTRGTMRMLGSAGFQYR